VALRNIYIYIYIYIYIERSNGKKRAQQSRLIILIYGRFSLINEYFTSDFTIIDIKY